jgi:tetratricopeptide (TPR) repeat protein
MPAKNSARKKQQARQGTRDLDVQIQFMEGIVRRDPAFVEALQLLGDHYAERGRLAESLAVDQRLSRLEPCDPLVFYNLACSCSLNGKFDRAAAALERALNLGYRDFNWLARDPDLRKLRKHAAYRSIKDKIRRMKIEAV